MGFSSSTFPIPRQATWLTTWRTYGPASFFVPVKMTETSANDSSTPFVSRIYAEEHVQSLTVSVVTISFNRVGELERTCQSVITQTHPLEWVVIDGGSTDGSQEIVRRYLRPGDIFVSEPDRGIADAFNKGLSRCHGEAVLFMNAGDEFAGPTSLSDLVSSWNRSRHRWIMGAAEVVDQHGLVLFQRGFATPPKDPFSLVRWNCQIMHQAVLAERVLFAEHGHFDERWRIAMDYDLWVRWITRGVMPQTVMVPVCRFYRGGVSGDPLRNVREERAVRTHNHISNGWIVDQLIAMLARIKRLVRGRYGRWFYRLKERLGVRV